MLFAKNKKLVLFPKSSTTELFLEANSNNHLSLGFSLLKESQPTDLTQIDNYLKSQKPEEVVILLSEEVMVTKSFVYDTKTTTIDKKEVIKLAHDVVSFELDLDNVEYSLEQTPQKTIIHADLFHKTKFQALEHNLQLLQFLPAKVTYLSLARAATKVVSNFYQQEYFLLYPYESEESTLILAKGSEVYATSKIKSQHPDLNKHINYSNLYFDKPIRRLFSPKGLNIAYKAPEDLETAEFEEVALATQLKKPVNFTLPIIGAFLSTAVKNMVKKPVVSAAVPEVTLPVAALPPLPTMNNTGAFEPEVNLSSQKRNSKPIIFVFLGTLLLVAGLVWFVFNRDNASKQAANLTPTPSEEISEAPTQEPTVMPTLPPINKKLKFQVLNATDINGQAATVKEKLVTLGFSDVATGNSKDQASENLIKVKKSYANLEDYFNQKLLVLGQSTFTSDLTESSKYDVVITIGTDLSKAPTSSEKPAATTSPTGADTTNVQSE